MGKSRLPSFAPMSALGVGFGLGFLVAAQVGPLSLLLIRSVLRHALVVGLAIGAAVALVDTSYALLGALGVAAVLDLDGVRTVLGLTGAAVLAWFGARTLWTAFRVRLGGEATEEVQAPRNAFWTALIACASNPLTIISWAAIFAAASTASVAGDAGSTTALLVGVGCGSFTWMAILSVAVNAARRKVGERGLQIADGVAGAGLLGFAGVLGLRTLSE